MFLVVGSGEVIAGRVPVARRDAVASILKSASRWNRCTISKRRK